MHQSNWIYQLLLFTSLSNTDLFPLRVRDEFIVPYVIKVVPCILVWGAIVIQLITSKNTDSTLPEN